MELREAMRERRSTRAFRRDDVSETVVRELLDEARWAPSWANAQGWDVFVIKGERLAKVKAMLARRFAADAIPVTDVAMPQRGEWPQHIRERMTYRRATPGSEPEPPRRPGLSDLYGAPCLVLVAVHEQLAIEYACFDAGLLVQNICLAATDRGLGTCIMAMAVRYADDLHELVPEADGRQFVVGIALGHPDPNDELNRAERKRCPLGEIVTLVE
jgi:nitroreductase